MRIGDALEYFADRVDLVSDIEYDLISIRRRHGGMFHRERLPGRAILTKSVQRVVPGSFVIARRQIVHGACAIAAPEFVGNIMSMSYSAFRGSPVCDAQYFFALAQQPHMVRYFWESSHGVVVEKLNFQQEEWLDYPVRLPPLKEQRRIGEILDTIDNTIHATERIIAKLEDTRVGLARDLFDGINEPPSRIRDLASLSSGSTPNRGRPDYWGGTIPWVKTGEVRGNVIEKSEEFITARALAECPLEVYPVGTVLVAMYGQGATRGRVAMLGVPASTNQACVAIQAASGAVLGSYLFEFLKRSYEALRSLAHGSHQENLSSRLVGDFELPIPDWQEQARVAAVLDSANARLNAESAELDKLRHTRTGLSADLLSGRVRTVAA
ncbi:MAG: hypothetical protein JWM34_1915 [Ilumatobacteraceae bacterium]|nr:hypothetical protein [Ilumatobacteraceae bacterium]